jgi:hypothetical protein
VNALLQERIWDDIRIGILIAEGRLILCLDCGVWHLVEDQHQCEQQIQLRRHQWNQSRRKSIFKS